MLTNSASFTRREFLTFEEEVDFLRLLTRYRMPPFTEGFGRFLSSTWSWINQGENSELEHTVFVLPDPSLNLSLPYPVDELSLAITVATGASANRKAIAALAERFQIDQELLDRPSTALSGGERMLVSLAKAYALIPRAELLCLSSPYFWLDTEHRHLVGAQFGSCSCEGHLLLLGGEDDIAPAAQIEWVNRPGPLSWHLQSQTPTVLFASQSFPRTTKEKTITFTQNDSSIEFASPTLITGRNGLGKTTLAKLLSGLIEPETGQIRIVTKAFSGFGRLVLQDSLLHLFGDSVDDHHGRIFSFDKTLGDKAKELLATVTEDCFSRIAETHSSTVLGNTEHRTILEAKIAVTIDRMFLSPPLLILDEPSWCLSRDVARALIQSIVAAAHRRGTAVAFISHQQQWWSGIAASELRLSAHAGGKVLLDRAK